MNVCDVKNHDTRSSFVDALSLAPELEIIYALDLVETRAGAERIYHAELAGNRRPSILAHAQRRLDKFDKRTTPNLNHYGRLIGVTHVV